MSWIAVDALNPGGRPSPDEILQTGADGVRMVAFDGEEFLRYLEECQDAGLQVGVVLARESFDDDDYAGWASYYAQRIKPETWSIGNEPDAYLLGDASPSSWKMRPAEYAYSLWHPVANTILKEQPDAKLVVGGLVAGAPWWLSGVLPLLDPAPWAADIHPYGKDAEEARELLHAYAAAWDTYFS